METMEPEQTTPDAPPPLDPSRLETIGRLRAQMIGIMDSVETLRAPAAEADARPPRGRLRATLAFRGHVPGSDPETRWRITVAEPGAEETDAEVTMYLLPGGGEQSSFRKPAVLSGWTGDLYISPMAIDPGVINVEVSTKPFIGVLWAGTILLVLGCGIAIVRHQVDGRVGKSGRSAAVD